MSDGNSNNARTVKNSLLSAAGRDFPFENFSTGAVLFPSSDENSLLSTSDGGEVDSFLGQNPSVATQLPHSLAATSEPKPFTSFSQGLISSKPPQGFAPQPFGTTLSHSQSVPSFQTSLPVLQIAPSTSTVFLPKPDLDQINLLRHGPSETAYTPPVTTAVTGLNSQLSTISLSSQSPKANSSCDLSVSSQNEPPVFTGPPVKTVELLTEVTNSYRLRSQKKPLYAQPPGLSTTTVPSSILYTHPSNGVMEAAAAATVQYQPAAPQPEILSYTNQAQLSAMYRPVYHHWFYKKEVETKVIWEPFSMVDSLALEEAFTSTEILPETVVATDGGRYDVNILRRQRLAVYWQESPTEVRRCAWFYKGSTDTRFVPYEENVSTRLEEEFKVSTTTNVWHRRIEFPNGETIVFHGPTVMVHYLQATSPDAWGNTPQTPVRPRIVKRGVDEFDIDEGEPAKVDHLLFLVHGIGSVCDLKFRTVEEVVDDFRSLSLQLVQSHFHTAMNEGKVNRIEVLPISWHATLHGEDTGIDRKLKSITLNSIPKLRHFTNDTLLDILFYTSPVYCQTIMDTVGKELNRLYTLFTERNPTFEGGVSLGGHSLGSLILFDLLYHQRVPEGQVSQNSNPLSSSDDKTENGEKLPSSELNSNQKISYVMGNAGTGQPFITYPQLVFQPKTFFALGSPIGMFVTVRGIDTLGEDFRLPTCPGFFNIFHPFDPVAYRIETLVNPELTNLRPVLIPHHKGRKRMHLELKETMARVGADLKQRLMESVRSTWNTVYQLAMFHRSDDQALQQEVDKVLEEQLHQQNEMENTQSGTDETDEDVCVGELNGGRRIDYVLQEAPLESFNEYLFALKTHVCYWESEDTMLMVLKEIYSTMGISVDSNSDKQNTNASSSSGLYSGVESNSMHSSASFVSTQDQISPIATFPPDVNSSPLIPSPYPGRNQMPEEFGPLCIGMDPTAPLIQNKNLGPPPMAGFVKKSKS